MKSKCLFVAISFLLTSCVTAPVVKEKVWLNNYYSDETFTKNTILDGGLSIAGITGKYSNISPDELKYLNYHLDDSIKQYFNTEKIYGSNEFKSKAGPNFIKEIRNQYFNNKFKLFSDEEKIKINSFCRYILFCKIIRNESGRNSRDYGNKKCYFSYRGMDIKMDIYDINLNKFVWGGRLARKFVSDNCNSRTELHTGNLSQDIVGAIVSTAVDSAFDVVTGTYPPTPNISKVFSIVANNFAENLPGAELIQY